VDAAFARYASTRGELIDLIKAQDWYKDGLDKNESLFVERMLAYVGRYGGPRTGYISDVTVKQKLFLADKATTKSGDVDLLVIYEPNQNAEKEMAFAKKAVPVLEDLVGVQWPERVVTIVNGTTNASGTSGGPAAGTSQAGFVQLARCCILEPGVLAHELAHNYWSYEVGPQWFAEGMADIYSALANTKMATDPPDGWKIQPVDVDILYRNQKAAIGGQLTSVIPKGRAADLNYAAFDALLLEIRKAMSPDAFSAAAKQIYLTSDFGRTSLKEKRLEDIFLANSAASAKQDVMNAFNKAVWDDNGEKYRQLVEQEGP
jgi:hypothetical protein